MNNLVPGMSGFKFLGRWIKLSAKVVHTWKFMGPDVQKSDTNHLYVSRSPFLFFPITLAT